MSKKKQIQIHIASESEMNQALIDAWHRAESSEQKEVEEHLYFEDAASLLKVLSNQRLALLTTLYRCGDSSIRALSKELHRNYKNVYDDVQTLKQAGLVKEKSSKRIFVPWQKIYTEISLAA